MPKQRHDIGRQKQLAAKPVREAAERRRALEKRLVRKRKRRAVVASTEAK